MERAPNKPKIIRESTAVTILVYATQMSLRASGKTQASQMLQEITSSNSERAKKYREASKT